MVNELRKSSGSKSKDLITATIHPRNSKFHKLPLSKFFLLLFGPVFNYCPRPNYTELFQSTPLSLQDNFVIPKYVLSNRMVYIKVVFLAYTVMNIINHGHSLNF